MPPIKRTKIFAARNELRITLRTMKFFSKCSSADAGFTGQVIGPAHLNLGIRGAATGLYSPPDLYDAHKQFGANCGPASFAAVARKPIRNVIHHFAHFPERDWTTIGDMKRALERAQFSFTETSERPGVGLALIQLKTAKVWVHPMAALSMTHWVAVYGDCFYDINWNGWLPIDYWEEIVFRTICRRRPKVNGWVITRALRLNGCLIS
jgi:hypothetical protein